MMPYLRPNIKVRIPLILPPPPPGGGGGGYRGTAHSIGGAPQGNLLVRPPIRGSETEVQQSSSNPKYRLYRTRLDIKDPRVKALKGLDEDDINKKNVIHYTIANPADKTAFDMPEDGLLSKFVSAAGTTQRRISPSEAARASYFTGDTKWKSAISLIVNQPSPSANVAFPLPPPSSLGTEAKARADAAFALYKVDSVANKTQLIEVMRAELGALGDDEYNRYMEAARQFKKEKDQQVLAQANALK